MNFLSLLSPTSILLGLVIALSISNALFINLWSSAKDDLVTYTAEVSLAQAQIDADVQRRLRLSEQVTSETRLALDTALASLRKRPAVRVLPANCNTGTGLKISSSSSGLNGTTAAPATDPAISLTAEQCEEQLNLGISDATRLKWWQNWYEEQREIYK